ncbi:hypothetical protein QTN94_14295 [Vibrio sp. M250220]|uniref:hypothetical protein n=1 Tax=Vibrio sp. M250220 TaxID=3020894 RepID=UPI002F41C011
MKYDLQFVREHRLSKTDIAKTLTLGKTALHGVDGYLPKGKNINYISVVCGLHKLIKNYHRRVKNNDVLNHTLDAFIFGYFDSFILNEGEGKIFDNASAPLQDLAVKIHSDPEKSVDYVNSAYAVFPDCYKY